MGRTYFELVENLEVNGVEVTHGNVLQQVLECKESSNKDELPAIAGKNGVVDLLEEDRGGGGGGECLGSFVDGEGERDGELYDLVEKYGGRGKVPVVARRGHNARVVHDLLTVWLELS